MGKAIVDERDKDRKFNAQIGHFNNRITDVDTKRIDHSHDDERGWSFSVSVAYSAKEAIIRRAAQSWILTHPPPPDSAGIMATPGYQGFCPSRLCHLKCSNPQVNIPGLPHLRQS